MQHFNGIVTFVKVCEATNFTEAGKRLGLSASAVGKSITKLEERLGVRLFHRNTRAIHLTDEGLQYLEHCQRAILEMEEGARRLLEKKQSPHGRLKVSLPLVCRPFQSTLMRFIKDYPELEVELDFSDRLVDIIEEGFDVVVRTGALTDSRLVSRHLGTCQMWLVGTPGYFAQHGVPATVGELQQHDCLRFRATTTGKLSPWPLPDAARVELRTRLICSHVEMLHHAAVDGLGIACLPDFLVRECLRRGELKAVLEEETKNSIDFHLVWPASQWRSVKLRAFIEFAASNLLGEHGLTTS
ncbi:LysR family transcriptional regulator [Paraburkholderia sp. D15]|uniref:LysR family transcriptional regulator n=1 Tax=Paraburkholderia sp. D15 TaxID=2880218 RepID=UPI0024796ADF|nr:LysR family transcriptional regulator [Paraburkholderia sp. D15]WGS48838.1 LysR family transcriptional regulator [Paraburkholderia sp. D15]WKF56725.1 HTH-type transcriptional regulator PgrR [Paraburkholderia busanensis]